MALDVSLKKVSKLPVVIVKGRAVDSDIRKLVKKLDTLYNRKFPTIVLDLTATEFLDSHALGTVVYYHTLMQKDKREFVIVNSNPNSDSYVNRLFELTHLDHVLKIVPSLQHLLGLAHTAVDVGQKPAG